MSDAFDFVDYYIDKKNNEIEDLKKELKQKDDVIAELAYHMDKCVYGKSISQCEEDCIICIADWAEKRVKDE
jgi:hypothetical protein